MIMPGKRKTYYDWKVYNRQLVERGKKLANRIKTINKEVLEFWDEELKQMNLDKVGPPYEYPNSQIIFLSIMRSAFNINSYRNLEGLGFLFFNDVPDYTRINRRIRQLDLDVIKRINREVTTAKTKNRVIEIAIDATGVQINNKYVWIDKKTKKMRKRDWRKISIAVDVEARQILGIKILKRNQHEGSHKNTLSLVDDVFANIDETSEISKAYADGGYDSNKNFEMLDDLGIEPVIRIRKRSREIAKFMNNTAINVAKRKKFFSKRRNREAVKQYYWKYFVGESSYGKRSGIEGIIGSFKRFFRENLFSRRDKMIEREIMTRVLIWNMMV
jgi:hypothetical protein